MRTESIYLGPIDGPGRLEAIEPEPTIRGRRPRSYEPIETYPAEIGLDRFPHDTAEPDNTDAPIALAHDRASVKPDAMSDGQRLGVRGHRLREHLNRETQAGWQYVGSSSPRRGWASLWTTSGGGTTSSYIHL